MKKNIHFCSQLVFCNSSILQPQFTQLRWEGALRVLLFLSLALHCISWPWLITASTDFSQALTHLAPQAFLFSSHTLHVDLVKRFVQPYLSLGCPHVYWTPEYSGSFRASEFHTQHVGKRHRLMPLVFALTVLRWNLIGYEVSVLSLARS